MSFLGSYKKAKIKIFGEVGTEELQVHFNPNQYQLSDGANYSEKNIPGLDGPIIQYVSGTTTTLTMELVFDTYEELYKNTSLSGTVASISSLLSQPEDVSKITRKIVALTEIDGSQHRPPMCQFIWGSLKFKGVVTKVDSTYTMFTEEGMPVRARLNVTFQSVLDITQSKKEAPFESPDRTKFRVMKEGMQLWHVAYQEYGDPELWRVIAQENGIRNPKDIYAGQMIRLPAL